MVGVAIIEDGRRAVSGSSDTSIRFWDVEPGAKVGGASTRHTGWVVSVVISDDGKCAVSGSSDKSIRVWDVDEGKQIGCSNRTHVRGVHRRDEC